MLDILDAAAPEAKYSVVPVPSVDRSRGGSIGIIVQYVHLLLDTASATCKPSTAKPVRNRRRHSLSLRPKTLNPKILNPRSAWNFARAAGTWSQMSGSKLGKARSFVHFDVVFHVPWVRWNVDSSLK